MSIGGIGVYDQQPQVSQDTFVVVGEPDVIRSQEITTNGVTNDVTYETGKDCHQESGSDNVAPEARAVLEIGKRRSVYLTNTTAEQYGQEAGCSVTKISRNDDCLESPERLLPQGDSVYHDAELVRADDDGEHQTLRDISRCAPREISYETSQCDVQSQHCNMQQQHCSVQPQHCDVQVPLPNRRTNRETHPREKNNVKNEIDSDENASHLLISLSNALNPGEAEYIDRYRPKGRPRGPKHPVWNFFKFYKSGGLTLGYMCLMCGNGFTGPPNTTNATKHLRCKHKHEYLLYFDLLEGAKQGTFFGDVHQSIRELVSKRGVKAEACTSEGNTTEGSALNYEIMNEGVHRSHDWTDDTAGSSQDAELHSFLCSALVSNTSKNSLVRYDVSNVSENSEVSSSGEVIFTGSSTGDTEAGSSAVSSDSTGQFAGQVESFLRDYRRLETECRRLRADVAAKDEHIKTLRLNLMEERNKRKSALILVQRALIDE
uniref:BED-type domain-containing protein n=1 Tax=Elaeophora elaphi TaxID=1147741 RepID=A0A0R3RHC1_9BILA